MHWLGENRPTLEYLLFFERENAFFLWLSDFLGLGEER